MVSEKELAKKLIEEEVLSKAVRPTTSSSIQLQDGFFEVGVQELDC
jgi:hypothetical protein